jgi:hypothetical protein
VQASRAQIETLSMSKFKKLVEARMANTRETWQTAERAVRQQADRGPEVPPPQPPGLPVLDTQSLPKGWGFLYDPDDERKRERKRAIAEAAGRAFGVPPGRLSVRPRYIRRAPGNDLDPETIPTQSPWLGQVRDLGRYEVVEYRLYLDGLFEFPPLPHELSASGYDVCVGGVVLSADATSLKTLAKMMRLAE